MGGRGASSGIGSRGISGLPEVKNSIEALQTAERQFKALKNLIATETSAKFWIDHRNTHPADPEWKKLRKSIVGY